MLNVLTKSKSSASSFLGAGVITTVAGTVATGVCLPRFESVFSIVTGTAVATDVAFGNGATFTFAFGKGATFEFGNSAIFLFE